MGEAAGLSQRREQPAAPVAPVVEAPAYFVEWQLTGGSAEGKREECPIEVAGSR